ncbi:hypothetical protein [Litoribrevibacter albus]|uniref:Uncharacterized protein n=1 Tax=Litoribrevibacter albus TaxID=1473156 RepID=A0AA37W6D1_9GAMM|nr:hypothetical protein [Litoribrevibacter albus]GLQ30223.1 hypothetical protein GCM10007876_07010 [Litoribrevibacter albus]
MMLNVIVRLIRISLICWIALFTSLFSSRLLAQEPFAPEPLVFSTIPNNPYAPLGIDVMTEAYQQLGRTITVIEYPSARALDLANRGIVDGELGRAGLTQEKYGDLVKIPVPLLTLNMVAFTKSLHFEVNGWESLLPVS